jgi:uncharacterized protein
MGQPVVHFELLSKDPAKLSAFYEKIFGWTVTPRPELNYSILETGAGAGINGGVVKPDRPEPWPGNTTVYIAVDDLAAYRKRILAAGGKILIEEQAVPGMGSFSLFADPEGRMMGLWRHAG